MVIGQTGHSWGQIDASYHVYLHLAIYFGSPFGRYPTFHTLTSVSLTFRQVAFKLIFYFVLTLPNFLSGLKDLLRTELSSTSKVATIFVSKTRDTLHDIFSAPSGWHFIAEILVIRPPNEHARKDMMRVILAGLSCKVYEDYELR